MRFRRFLLVATALALFFGPGCFGSYGFGWQEYKKRFLSPDGRIIDTYQNRMSHSEGQGYGLLLSLANDDRDSFDRIWNWTRNNLQLRKGDSLLCWSWGKRPNGSWQVLDYNDASDGDILVAWALYLGWRKWGSQSYRKAAQELVASIRHQLAIRLGSLTLILPGYYGFHRTRRVVLNPSYMITAAFKDFARIEQPEFWHRVLSDSERLLEKAVFGPLSLPPDWILWDGDKPEASPHAKGPRFSYDAWRVFLYASWSGHRGFLRAFEGLWNFFGKNGYLPESIDVQKGCVSLKQCPAGAYAALAAFAGSVGKKQEARVLFHAADQRIGFETENYFSTTLYLLSRHGFGKVK